MTQWAGLMPEEPCSCQFVNRENSFRTSIDAVNFQRDDGSGDIVATTLPTQTTYVEALRDQAALPPPIVLSLQSNE